MESRPRAALARLGIELPPAPAPVGLYTPVVTAGELAFVSGQIVARDGRAVAPGLVDRDVDVATASGLARSATLQAMSALAAALGDLDRIRRPVQLRVFVATSPGFARVHE